MYNENDIDNKLAIFNHDIAELLDKACIVFSMIQKIDNDFKSFLFSRNQDKAEAEKIKQKRNLERNKVYVHRNHKTNKFTISIGIDLAALFNITSQDRCSIIIVEGWKFKIMKDNSSNSYALNDDNASRNVLQLQVTCNAFPLFQEMIDTPHSIAIPFSITSDDEFIIDLISLQKEDEIHF